MHPQPKFVLDISQEWPRKREAIQCFASQFIVGREHLDPGFIEQLEYEARYWGKSIGVAYGEPFTSREPLGLRAMDALI